MTIKEALIDLLAKAVMELPEKTETAVKVLLEQHVGPLADDSAALAAARDALKASQNLNDQAEVLCDALLKKLTRAQDVIIYTGDVDTVWSRLNHARTQQKRELTATL